MKKNILIFVAGMFVAVGLGYLYLSQKLPFVSEGLHFVNKAATKMQDWKFNKVLKAKQDLMICDFESSGDLSIWKLINSSIQQSKNHFSHGVFSGMVSFEATQAASGIKLEEYFEKNKIAKDWSAYQSVAFDVYNPRSGQQRLVVQVKDKSDKCVKKDFLLEPQSSAVVEVEVSRLRHEIDIYNISDFTIFLWAPGDKALLYVDNIRLIGFGEESKKSIYSSGLMEDSETAYATGDYFDFSKHKSKWLRTDQEGATFVEFPIILTNESNLDCPELPFSGGIPFPRGEIKDISHIKILDETANAINFQAKPLCRWQDGSVKWLLVDLKQDLIASQKKALKIRYADTIKEAVAPGNLKVSESPDQITVITGPLKFSVKRHNFNLFDGVWVDKNKDGVFQDDELLARDCNMAVKFNGKYYLSSFDKDSKVTVEENGPIKTTLKAEGWFINNKGERFCKYVVRIQSFADADYLRVSHTFIYTGYPENMCHYLYKGKRLPKNETIEGVSIILPVNLRGDKSFTFKADKQVLQGVLKENCGIYQNNFNSFTIEKSGIKIHSGEKLDGWLDESDSEGGITVGIKNLWQQFPKQFYLDKAKNRLEISLWPEKAGPLDLKTTEAALGPDSVARGSAFGLAKTHELFFNFHSGNYQESKTINIINGLFASLPIITAPEWLSDTVAIGKVSAYDSRLNTSEVALEKLFDWGKRQQDNFNWYGMVDFGDTLSWYRKDAYDKSYDESGWHPEGRWGWFNCETMGTHSGALIQYLRTGQVKYFRFGEDLTRHIMDIDTCHYNTVENDKRLRGVIPDDYSQVGSMHRHNGNHWGDRNEETSHTNIFGLMLYYYITGNERARDVLDEVGSFFLKERIVYFRHPDVAPQRSLANVLWGDVSLYELTNDERYKKQADKLANIFYQGQHSNGSWPDSYNPVEKRWDGDSAIMHMVSYTLPALIDYHKLTRNKAIKECILKGTEYLIKNDDLGHQFDSIAYSFWLTGEAKYQYEGQKRLEHLIAHQNSGNDPIMEGMIYGKAYYLRVVDFLFRTPFIYGVLNYPLKNARNE